MRAIFRNNCDAPWPCAERCAKDYRSVCPLGWYLRENGNCEASEIYFGPCLRLQSFGNLNHSEKKSLELTCGISWPCQACDNEHKQWDDNCPDGWEEVKEDNICRPGPLTVYNGPCWTSILVNQTKERKNLSVIQLVVKLAANLEKIELENRCGVIWKCFLDPVECVENLTTVSYTFLVRLTVSLSLCVSKLCPNNWNEIRPGVCKAPDEYNGRCSAEIDMSKFDVLMRINFAKHCQREICHF